MPANNNFQDFQDFAKREKREPSRRETLAFAREHEGDDTTRLLLSASRYPDIDMPLAVQQIEGRRTAREKWPSLLECDTFLYPPRLNREQASSEETARYKARLLHGASCADLTGGMGIDTLALAQQFDEVHYIERNPELCTLMEHNLRALGIGNVTVHCADSMEWLSAFRTPLSALYIDPARRSASGRKVAAFEDCEPNILQHKALLRSRCRQLVVKASPMIDIDLGIEQLDGVAEVHVVEAGGECKEVLFLCGDGGGEPVIHCGAHTFTRSSEAAAEAVYCTGVRRYLYEPAPALMKASPYRSICHWYSVEKLARNSHLYTSDRLVDDFPGRRFEVRQALQLSKKEVASVLPDGRAHVVTRNYPVAAADLQRQLGLKEGGELFVVATTVGNRPCGFLCGRI